MTRTWVVTMALFAIAAGAATASQAAINRKLMGELHEPTRAAAISFTIGTVFCWLYCLGNRSPWPSTAELAALPWWIWTGGMLGTIYILASVIVGQRLGVAAMLALVIAGQMVTSLTIEHFGWFGAAVRPASLERVAGAALVAGGAALFVIRQLAK